MKRAVGEWWSGMWWVERASIIVVAVGFALTPVPVGFGGLVVSVAIGFLCAFAGLALAFLGVRVIMWMARVLLSEASEGYR